MHKYIGSNVDQLTFWFHGLFRHTPDPTSFQSFRSCNCSTIFLGGGSGASEASESPWEPPGLHRREGLELFHAAGYAEPPGEVGQMRRGGPTSQSFPGEHDLVWFESPRNPILLI